LDVANGYLVETGNCSKGHLPSLYHVHIAALNNHDWIQLQVHKLITAVQNCGWQGITVSTPPPDISSDFLLFVL
jgi:hypothetical protein